MENDNNNNKQLQLDLQDRVFYIDNNVSKAEAIKFLNEIKKSLQKQE